MEKVETVSKPVVKGSGIKILLGSGIAFLITLISLLIVSIILTYTNVSENIITVAVIVISALSIFIGSIISAVNINKNGILNGSLVGAIYMITIYLLSSIFVSGFGMNIQAIVMIIASIIAGMVGGIIGVNFHKWNNCNL